MRLPYVTLCLVLALGCQGDNRSASTPGPEHAVIVTIPLSDTEFGAPQERYAIQGLASELEAAIDAAGAGEYDGDEFGDGKCTLYMYGPDADVLFSAIEPVLRQSPIAKGGEAVKRFGEASDASAKEVVISL